MSYTPVNYTVATAPPLTTIQEHLAGLDTALAAAGTTNLTFGNQTINTADLQSSSGTDATMTAATALLAGLMSGTDKAKLDLITVAAATDLGAITTQQGNTVTLSGVAANAADNGIFTGTTIPDASTTKAALQSLETAVEAITGVTNLGYVAAANNGQVTSSTGTDATIPAVTATDAGLALPAHLAKLDFIGITQAVDLDALEQDVADLTTLTGQASNATDFGVGFTGATIPDNSDLTQALQALETALEAVPTRIQTVVADIAARDAQAGTATGDLTWVVDASADGTVTAGGALYIVDGGGAYQKVAESESLDVVTDLSIGTITTTSVEVVSSSGTNANLPAATNAAAGVATAGQITNLENLITLTGLAADSASYTTLVTGDVVSDNATLLQALIDLEVGMTLVDRTQAQLLAIGDTVNTTGKFAGKKVRVTDRGGASGLIAFATTGAAGGAWISSDGLYIATPV